MLFSEDGNRGDGGLVVVQEAKKAGISFAPGPSGRQQVNKNMVKALQGNPNGVAARRIRRSFIS